MFAWHGRCSYIPQEREPSKPRGTATVRRIDKYALVPAEADKHCLVNILICCRPSIIGLPESSREYDRRRI